MDFKIHSIESAPQRSKSLLGISQATYGMIPNLHAVMAESPQLLKAYQEVHALFSQTSFDETELTIVWQTVNLEHDCHYCVPAHTAIAKCMGLNSEFINALIKGEDLPNDKLNALRHVTQQLVRNRGHISKKNLESFFQCGYTQKHLLEIVLGIAQKVMSNYTNHLADTPIDNDFKSSTV